MGKYATSVGNCSKKFRPVGIQFEKTGDGFSAVGSFTIATRGRGGAESGELNGNFSVAEGFRCKYCGNAYLYQCKFCGAFVCYDGNAATGMQCPSCGKTSDVPAGKDRRIHVSGVAASSKPKRIMIAMDVSASMLEPSGYGTRLDETKRAATEQFVGKFRGSQLAVVAFSTGTRTLIDFTMDIDAVKNTIRNITAGGGTTSPFTHICERHADFIEDASYDRYIVVFTDGAWSSSAENIIKKAQKLISKGIKILTIGCAGADKEFLKGISSADSNISVSDGNIESGFATAARRITQA